MPPFAVPPVCRPSPSWDARLLAVAEAEAAALAAAQEQLASLQSRHAELQQQYASAKQQSEERDAQLAALQQQLAAAQSAAEQQRSDGASSWAAWKRSGAEVAELRGKLTEALKLAEEEREARQGLEAQRAELEAQRTTLERQLAESRAEAAASVPKPIAALAKALGVSMPQAPSRVVPAGAGGAQGNAVPAVLASMDGGDDGYSSSEEGAAADGPRGEAGDICMPDAAVGQRACGWRPLGLQCLARALARDLPSKVYQGHTARCPASLIAMRNKCCQQATPRTTLPPSANDAPPWPTPLLRLKGLWRTARPRGCAHQEER